MVNAQLANVFEELNIAGIARLNSYQTLSNFGFCSHVFETPELFCKMFCLTKFEHEPPVVDVKRFVNCSLRAQSDTGRLVLRPELRPQSSRHRSDGSWVKVAFYRQKRQGGIGLGIAGTA